MTFTLYILCACLILTVAYIQSTESKPSEMMITKHINISRKNIWGPWKRIPNVRSMKIKVHGWDKLLILFGIHRRETKATLTFHSYKNGRINRYAEHQLRRLRRMTDEGKYWRVCQYLMRNSITFFILSLNHVFPLWYRNLPLHKVLSLKKGYDKISGDNDWYVYKIVDIPKANGKIRSLSVPTPAWRIYLHSLYCFLYISIDKHNKIHPNQHGFIPGRGTGSAWKHILEEVIKAPNIYEFDLKGFFPNLNVQEVCSYLSLMKIPSNVVKRIMLMNFTRISRKDENRTDPYWGDLGPLMHNLLTMNFLEGGDWMRPAKSLHYTALRKRISGYDRLKQPVTIDLLHGLHQGSAISPILSTVALNETLFKQPNETLMYADDGLLYGEDNRDPRLNATSSRMNINFAPEKCGWVKKDNIWLKPLTFLGLQYDPWRNELSGHTRKGSRLTFDNWLLIEKQLDRLGYDYHKIKSSDPKAWESMFKSHLWGFIQSRLYQGEWDLDSIDQCFELTYKAQSYVSKYHGPHLTLHNASSYACHDLMLLIKKMKR